MSPATEALLYAAALSPIVALGIVSAVVLLRDRRASSYVPRGLPPSFQLLAQPERIVVPSARVMRKAKRGTLTRWWL